MFTVNGHTYDWGSVDFKIPGGTQTAAGVQSISYEDEYPAEPVYGRGNTPIGYGRGKYKSTGQLTILRQYSSAFEAALAARSGGTGVLNHEPIEVTVNYANRDQPMQTDVLRSVLVTKRAYSGKSGDQELMVNYDLAIIGGIKVNGVEPA
ncbi:MAG: hypothetical protein IV100_12600 [Myxococcales bacterium]|uniref:hypothetical protein n=1 Tax=Sediminibacterium sp. TaxID=1917865 RepID=UPI001D697FC7|nr:hypothetical protein [Sediminibacterium sp.]MBT9485839.1 hypothetical protein [Sediminibacterium sp.]MBT9556866.1 hypothetical protein [Myxococcales bacterium]